MGGVIYDWSPQPFYDWCFEITTDKGEMKKNLNFLDFDTHMSGLESVTDFALKMCDCYKISYFDGIEKEIERKMMEGNGAEFSVTLKMMKILREKGVQNALLSNAFPMFSKAWRNDELMSSENSFFSFNLGLVKPNPKIYEVVRERLNVSFEELIFVDDKQENVDVACALGIKGIVFNEATIEEQIKQIASL